MLDEIKRRHAAVLDAQRPVAVEKQHAKGQLTARERISLLLDDGETLIESGSLAEPADRRLEAPADAVVVGLGRVHKKPAVVLSYDFTALGGSQGYNNHAKTSRAMYLAEHYLAPVFILAEGGGTRTQELDLFRGGRSSILGDFEWLSRLSGRVPLIGLALGRNFAGHAIFLGESDVIIATETSAIGIAGPPLVKAATGLDLTADEIGGARIHEAAGAVERIVHDDREAIAEARTYARFFIEPSIEHSQAESTVVDSLRDVATKPGSFDMRRVIDLVADRDSLFELRPAWSPGVITALARVGGRAVGIVATDPCTEAGVLRETSCDKIARFMSLCNAFGLPIVVFVDTVGPATSDVPDALFRHAARIPIALARCQVPVITFIVGRVGGVAQTLLGGFGRFLEGAPNYTWHYMWPRALVEGLGVAQGDGAGLPLAVAAAYATDDVIDPGETRDITRRIIAIGSSAAAGNARPIDPW